MKRGDIVLVALQGDYGKPRPAVVVQSDFFEALPSVTVLPVTSDLRDLPIFRLSVDPSETNGLRKRSEIMVDKIHTVRSDRIGQVIGRLDEASMIAVTRSLALFLGIA